MARQVEFAPAKLNLFLAVTGRRSDGFHELVSLVAPLALGDGLTVETTPGAPADTLACDDPAVPADASNLVLKAAAAFRRHASAGAPPPVHFTLRKQTPAGAGLGGGSSDAAAALRALNRLAASPLAPDALHACAAEVGSDVPLFLAGGPVLMRGRGEKIEPLPAPGRAVLRGLEVLVFKPSFGVSTAWAYQSLAARALGGYVPAAEAEARLAAWLAAPSRETLPLANNLEPPVFAKYAALPVLLDELRARFGLRAQMSGSGSACFAILHADSPRDKIEAAIRDAWSPEAFIRATTLAG